MKEKRYIAIGKNLNCKYMLGIRRISLVMGIAAMLSSCYPDEALNEPVREQEENLSELDLYIKENFTDKYNMAIRYRYVDRFVSPFQKVTPPKMEVVEPMLDFIQDFWIDPYLEVQNGEEFFSRYVPSEIVLLGGLIYNENGTVILGTADAGARITFTNVNAIDIENDAWVELQLQTVYHEFAHTVHQEFKLPPSFENISPTGYSGPGSWFTLSDEEALRRGFVSPYATSNPNEDFAETVAFLLFNQDFMEFYLTDEEDCATSDCVNRNIGRERIRQKVNAITEHYEKVTSVDLYELRNVIQAKLQ